MGSMSNPASPVNSMSPASSLQPTWTGYISDTWDALILFEAAIGGHLNRVVRRPHDRERNTLIRSGSIFIYEESASGIKRWTDGVAWSPSRILNNFLIYRELEKPFPPGEKKRATKKQNKSPQTPTDPFHRPSSGDEARSMAATTTATATPQASSTRVTAANTSPTRLDQSADREAERSLVGSLTDSYAFKDGGLVKKTMSVVVEGVHYHLVSYYNPEDVKANMLQKPRDTDLRYIKVRGDLIQRQNFRAPIDDIDESIQTSFSTQEHSQTPFHVSNAGHHTYMSSPGYLQPSMTADSQFYNNQSPVAYSIPQQRYQMPQQPFAEPARVTSMQQNPQSPQSNYYPNMTENASHMHIKPEYSEFPQYQGQRAFNPTSHDYGTQQGWTNQ